MTRDCHRRIEGRRRPPPLRAADTLSLEAVLGPVSRDVAGADAGPRTDATQTRTATRRGRGWLTGAAVATAASAAGRRAATIETLCLTWESIWCLKEIGILFVLKNSLHLVIRL